MGSNLIPHTAKRIKEPVIQSGLLTFQKTNEKKTTQDPNTKDERYKKLGRII